MIAHVAEASEGSGRVLFWLEPKALTSPSAIDGATRLAAAFGSEIETLVIDDGAITRARQISVSRLTGNTSGGSSSEPTGQSANEFAANIVIGARGRSIGEADRAMSLLGERQRRVIETRASALGVPVHHTITAGDAIDQLTGLCLMAGPWNVIALSHEPTAETAATVSSIMANVSGATGVVIAGRGPTRQAGPIAVVAEDCVRLPSMIRAAERLRTPGCSIHLFLAAETASDLCELEAGARLAATDFDHLILEAASPTLAIQGTLDEALRRLEPGYVIARFGGTLLPGAKALMRTIALTAAPFLLVR